ncbi:MAG: MmcQ/YjbR family DNA-binding protein [Anaerolineae bacterium]
MTKQPVTIETLRHIALAFPGMEEYPCWYGKPAFRVRGNTLARVRKDGESLVIRINDPIERDFLLENEPDVYYANADIDHPYVFVRLATISPDELQRIFENAWRAAAPKRLIAEYDNQP